MITNAKVIEIANELGFGLVGFAPADELTDETSRLRKWLNNGYQAGMEYMERNLEKRRDVSEILPGAKSVISLGMNYYKDEKHEAAKPKVSRYAWGRDYHYVIWEKLGLLEEKLKRIDSSFEAVTYVDTGPVMDKAWAVRSGIGWLGKHTNVISRDKGSWFFIATVITNYEFDYNQPVTDFCGTCTACLDACPTNAIVDEYVVDSNRCISYLTIENKGDIAEKFTGKFDDWVFGCDICQDVCPWNQKFPQESNIPDFEPKDKHLSYDEIKNMTNSQFKKRFAESPIKRAKLKGLKRNLEHLHK